MKLRVIGPRVMVRPDKQPEVTTTGIHMVYERQNSTMRGEVVAVGNGSEFIDFEVRRKLAAVKEKLKGLRAATAVDDVLEGVNYAHVVKPGDRVLFSPDKGTELFFERDLLICLLEDDILAIVDTE